jgi:rod shape-determining protein MreC
VSITEKAKDRAKRNPNLLFGVLIVLHLILISFNRTTERPDLRIFQIVIMTMLTPFQSGIGSTAAWMSGKWQSYLHLRGVREENQQLKADLSRADAEMIRLRGELATYQNLRGLLDSRVADSYQKITARVVSRDANHLFGTVVIDKGSIHGIKKDQPVVDAYGLVGRVVIVTPISSRVLLVTDERHGTGALITTAVGEGILGVIRGVRDNFFCEMDFITTPVKIQNGEPIVTSGQDGLYPAGLLIGRVANPADRSASTQQRIVIAPAAALSRLDMVAVLQVTREQIRVAAEAVESEEKRQEAEAATKK